MGAITGWAVVELMGHRRLVGKVEEVEVAGAGFLRVEVLGEGGAFTTQFYAPGAVYCVTPTTEQNALRCASLNTVAPVSPWELRLPERAGQEHAGVEVFTELGQDTDPDLDSSCGE